jgi:hypothetical protein
LKRPGREVDHLTPSSAEVRNEWKCNFTPILRLYWVNSYKFTFYPLYFKNNILNIGECNLGLWAIRRPVLPCGVNKIVNGSESQVSVLGLNGFLETSGSDHPLKQCRIPGEMYLQLHSREKPRTRILEIRQSFTGIRLGLYCVNRDKDTRSSGLNISKT